jgi:hypothetical protein
MNQSPTDNFSRLRDARLAKALAAMGMLGNLADRRYHATPEMGRAIVDRLQKGVDAVANRFGTDLTTPEPVAVAPEPVAVAPEPVAVAPATVTLPASRGLAAAAARIRLGAGGTSHGVVAPSEAAMEELRLGVRMLEQGLSADARFVIADAMERLSAA